MTASQARFSARADASRDQNLYFSPARTTSKTIAVPKFAVHRFNRRQTAGELRQNCLPHWPQTLCAFWVLRTPVDRRYRMTAIMENGHYFSIFKAACWPTAKQLSGSATGGV